MKKGKEASFIGLALALAMTARGACAAACFPEQAFATDSLGRRVALPVNVERVLSVEPEVTRIIAALGMGGRLAGLDYFLLHHDHIFPAVFPEAMKLRPVSNAGNELNLETAVLLRPDIIFVSPSEVTDPDSLSSKLGVPVMAVSSAGRFEELYREIALLGAALGCAERAEALLSFLKKELADVEERTYRLAADKKPRVFLAFWGSFTRSPVHYDPVTAAGGLNLAGSLPTAVRGTSGTSVQVEQVIAWDPDVILVHGAYPPNERTVTQESVLSDRRLASVRAVREGRVFYTFGFWYWWDPALVLVETKYLAWRLHPGLFPDFDLQAEGERIFGKFYGNARAYSALAEKLGCHEWVKGER